MTTMLKNLWRDEEGAAAAEYVLVLALAAIAIIAGASLLGTAMNTRFSDAATSITNAK